MSDPKRDELIQNWKDATKFRDEAEVARKSAANAIKEYDKSKRRMK